MPYGPYRPDAIWQRDANFQFSMTFNFFSNIRDHLAILAIWSAYLVKFLSVDGFIQLFLKTENSRRVAESRPVFVGLYTFENLTLQN